MKYIGIVAGCIVLSAASLATAQENLVGTWTASYTSTGIQSTLQSLSIRIESIEDGRVKAVGTS